MDNNFLIDLTVRGLFVCGAWWLLRRRLVRRGASAAARHACGVAAVWALLLLPLLTLALPSSSAPAALPVLPVTLPVTLPMPPAPPTTPAPPTPPLFAAPVAVPPITGAATVGPTAGATLGALYLLAAGVLLARLALCVGGAVRLLRTGRPVLPGERLDMLFQDAAREIGTRSEGIVGAARLRVTDAVATPMTAGRTVLLPADAAHWADDRLDAVLRHELAHVRRSDWRHLVCAEVACALFFVNPLAWRLARTLRADAEKAADDRVLTSGVAPTEYASHLLALAAAG